MRSILQRLLFTYIAIIFITVGILSGALVYFLTNYYFTEKETQLEKQGQRISKLITQYKAGKISKIALEEYVNGAADSSGARIVALSLHQAIQLKSREASILSKLNEDRFYDIKTIMSGQTVKHHRKFGVDLTTDVVFVGMPVKSPQGKVDGILLLFSPMTEMRNTIRNTNLIVLGTVGVSTVVAIIMIIGMSRRISKPLVTISGAAVRMAEVLEQPDVKVRGNDEIGQLASSFNYMKNRILQVENMRRDLLNNVSHELRTPLTSIMGFIQAILDGKIKAEDQPKYLTFALQEARRLNRLVNDILLLGYLQSNNLELRSSIVSLPDLVDEVLHTLGLEITAKDVKVEHIVPIILPEVPADEDRIKQVIINILSNALKHNPSGGSIRITYSVDETYVTVVISDTGHGIAQQDLQYIFDKFYQTDKSRSSGGTGLGLSIVKHLVELHGGHVAAHSVLGEGTTIQFSIPTAR
ncbi:MAG: ATP-binding protein [Acidobacteriota bacterium]